MISHSPLSVVSSRLDSDIDDSSVGQWDKPHNVHSLDNNDFICQRSHSPLLPKSPPSQAPVHVAEVSPLNPGRQSQNLPSPFIGHQSPVQDDCPALISHNECQASPVQDDALMATPQLRGSVSTAQDEHASVREPHILNLNACEFLIKQHKVHAETREREDVYIDSQADYLLYEALDQVEQPIDTQLPEFPTCPGPDLVPHIYTVWRPDPSPRV